MSPSRQDPELDRIMAGLGYRFKDRALLGLALSHRSHAHESGAEEHDNYERLEFLGDALLGFFVSDWLYHDDDRAAEGILSRRRQSVVRAATLSRAARELGLGEAIRLGRGEERTGGRSKPSLMADVFEAVLGAVYLDGGIRPARAFVRRHLRGALSDVREELRPAGDFKTRLQEAVQARLQRTPRYRIVSRAGPDHALEFEVEVQVDGRALGRGRGSTRKRAEQDAARRALKSIDDEEPA